MPSLFRRRPPTNRAARRPLPPRPGRARSRPRLLALEDRINPVAITPEPAGFVGINPGHAVQFRQTTGAALNTVTDADALFAGTIPAAFTASDSGVAVINYADLVTSPAPQQNFGNDRDIRAVPG